MPDIINKTDEQLREKSKKNLSGTRNSNRRSLLRGFDSFYVTGKSSSMFNFLSFWWKTALCEWVTQYEPFVRGCYLQSRGHHRCLWAMMQWCRSRDCQTARPSCPCCCQTWGSAAWEPTQSGWGGVCTRSRPCVCSTLSNYWTPHHQHSLTLCTLCNTVCAFLYYCTYSIYISYNLIFYTVFYFIISGSRQSNTSLHFTVHWQINIQVDSATVLKWNFHFTSFGNFHLIRCLVSIYYNTFQLCDSTEHNRE